jgi:hypothetical protein
MGGGLQVHHSPTYCSTDTPSRPERAETDPSVRVRTRSSNLLRPASQVLTSPGMSKPSAEATRLEKDSTRAQLGSASTQLLQRKMQEAKGTLLRQVAGVDPPSYPRSRWPAVCPPEKRRGCYEGEGGGGGTGAPLAAFPKEEDEEEGVEETGSCDRGDGPLDHGQPPRNPAAGAPPM